MKLKLLCLLYFVLIYNCSINCSDDVKIKTQSKLDVAAEQQIIEFNNTDINDINNKIDIDEKIIYTPLLCPHNKKLDSRGRCRTVF